MTATGRKQRDFINCLDHGYVRWVDGMGDDLSVVNAARASYMKESREFDGELNDSGLLKFLWRENEMSPFRHATMTLEVYAPLMVARQWWKYVVGSNHDPLLGWNESSRRYVTEEPQYYTPWFRKITEAGKQGSREPVEVGVQTFWRLQLEELQDESIKLYEKAIETGIAPEQARVFLLGYGLYVRWRWTCSLQGCIHFLHQRMERKKAQHEIAEYADAVYDLAARRYPKVFEYFGTDIVTCRV
jgi:thymidylate synthase (FAD)